MMVNILSVILGGADHTQEQMDNVSREMKTLRIKNMLESKSIKQKRRILVQELSVGWAN